jgi:predicted  nucleic acid-binding Zn-ribbon protein
MAEVIGKVAHLDGKFYARAEDGSLRELSKGDTLYVGEIVIGDSGNDAIDSVIVSLNDGNDIVVLADQSQAFDQSLTQTEFTPDETVSQPSSILSMLEESGDITAEDIEAIETAAGEEGAPDSTGGMPARFAVRNDDEGQDLNVALKKDFAFGETEDNPRDEMFAELEELRRAASLNDEIVSSTQSDETSVSDTETEGDTTGEGDAAVEELYQAAQDAAAEANTAIETAQDAANELAANTNPTQEEIDAAQDAIDAANDAINNANEAAQDYVDAATNAGEDVQETTTVGNTTDAQTTLDNAVTAENASDAAVEELYQAAQDAAAEANTAIETAQDAANELAANTNPTQEEIDAAQDAIDAANDAINNANEAAQDYVDAATNAGEDVQETTTVGNTTDAQTIVDGISAKDDLTFVSEDAGYKNVVGFYELDSDGKPTGEATIVIDDQNGMTGGTHLADMDPAKDYGFFVVPNGANSIDGSMTITIAEDGSLVINGAKSDLPVYHDNEALSSDGQNHFVFESDGNGGMNIRIEDTENLGDGDFNDIVLHTNFELSDKLSVPQDETLAGEDGFIIPSGEIKEFTYEFGAEHANQTVVISFKTDIDPDTSLLDTGWDSNQFLNKNDYFRVNVNGEEVLAKTAVNDLDNNVEHTIEVKTDANGQIKLEMHADSNGKDFRFYKDNEDVAIRDLKVEPGDDWQVNDALHEYNTTASGGEGVILSQIELKISSKEILPDGVTNNNGVYVQDANPATLNSNNSTVSFGNVVGTLSFRANITENTQGTLIYVDGNGNETSTTLDKNGRGYNSYSFDVPSDVVEVRLQSEGKSAIPLQDVSYKQAIEPEDVDARYEYTIELNNSDAMSFSNVNFDGLPEGTQLVEQEDGSYTFESTTQIDTNSIIATAEVEATQGDDTVSLDDSISAFDGGAGIDTLLVEGENIDLSGLSEHISNIETIKLGKEKQEISLSVEDVFEMTDENHTLRIDSDASDSVNLVTEQDWRLGDNITVDGATYEQYTAEHQDTTVTVQIQVHTEES